MSTRSPRPELPLPRRADLPPLPIKIEPVSNGEYVPIPLAPALDTQMGVPSALWGDIEANPLLVQEAAQIQPFRAFEITLRTPGARSR